MTDKKIRGADIVNYALLAACFAAILTLGVISGQKWFKMLPALISLAVMLLNSRVNRLGFLLGGLNALFYGAGYFAEGLYGLLVQAVAVSAPVQLVTFARWKKRAYGKATVLKRLSVKWEIALFAATAAVWTAAFFIVRGIAGANQSALDVTCLVFGTAATFLTMFALMETLAFQIVNILSSLAIWCIQLAQGEFAEITYFIGALFSAYCTAVLCVNWIKLYKKQRSETNEQATGGKLDNNIKTT